MTDDERRAVDLAYALELTGLTAEDLYDEPTTVLGTPDERGFFRDWSLA